MDHHDLTPSIRKHDAGTKGAVACVDCPAVRASCFEAQLSDGTSPCRFVKGTIAGRGPVPVAWAERYAFALVRRGVIVRTRATAEGPSVAIDCAGPGAILPFPSRALEIGYAATDVLVCLYARDGLEHALASDPEMSRSVYEGFAAALDRVERLAEARGQSRAENRVACVIATVAETMSPPVRRDHLPAGLQQRDLARLAGVRHESFCRIIGKLERAGTIERHEGGLRIESHEALTVGAA